MATGSLSDKRNNAIIENNAPVCGLSKVSYTRTMKTKISNLIEITSFNRKMSKDRSFKTKRVDYLNRRINKREPSGYIVYISALILSYHMRKYSCTDIIVLQNRYKR